MPGYEALTQTAGIAPPGDRTLIEVTGSDRLSLVNSFCTNDVKRLAAGQGCEAFVLNPQGKTIGHALIFHRGGSLLVDGAAGQAQTLIPHWERYVVSEDVTFRDLSASETSLLLAGPKSAAILEKVGLAVPSGLPGCAEGVFQGQSLLIKKTDYLGPETFFLQAPRAAASELSTALLAAGAEQCDAASVESLRIEQGSPLFGLDLTDDNLPQEIGRDRQAISFQKGCYLGQETVARIDALGHVNRLLIGLKIAGPVPAAGSPVLAEGKEVGRITSAANSPKLGATLALTLVRRAQAKVGTTLTVDSSPATVVPLPV
ncbi:MAG: glycine cleavage T C-terminal barrel domain-containing protein [Pirellulaceae bacterium]|nr:glycine cleavage T C-terminal barrel domain-containing protein [Pirellulaceae bacterium]